MLPTRKGRLNAGSRRGTGTPIGTRNLSPREPVVLPPDDYDQTGGDFYDCEWEHVRPARWGSPVLVGDDDADDLTGAVATSRAQREEARPTEARDRDGPEAATASSGETDGADSDAGGHTAAGSDAAESAPLSPDEARRLARRDRRIVKRLGDAEKMRLVRINHPAALAGESAYAVVCHGAVVRYAAGRAADAYAELYNTPPDGPREERQAGLGEAMAVVARWKQTVARYDAWVAEHLPELADDGLLDLLAGSKDDRAAAKARLAGVDRKYRTGTGMAGTATPTAAAAGDAAVSPALIYQKEFRGKVRACPEWVARVLRRVARKQARHIPAMAFVLAQLAYWTEPTDGTGRPRAKRSRCINNKWWVVLGYGQIEKQTPVSKGQARQAVKVLKELGLVETLAAKDANVGTDAGGVDFGPNTVFLRVNTVVLDPLVKETMSGTSKSGFEK